MIAPLRRLQRRASYVLAPLAGCILVLASAGRGPFPSPAQALRPPSWAERTLTLGGTRWYVAFDATTGALRLAAETPPQAPDLWLYLADGPAQAGAGLPAGARLLGPWQNTLATYTVPTPLPAAAELCFFSLAWSECLGSFRFSQDSSP